MTLELRTAKRGAQRSMLIIKMSRSDRTETQSPRARRPFHRHPPGRLAFRAPKAFVRRRPDEGRSRPTGTERAPPCPGSARRQGLWVAQPASSRATYRRSSAFERPPFFRPATPDTRRRRVLGGSAGASPRPSKAAQGDRGRQSPAREAAAITTRRWGWGQRVAPASRSARPAGSRGQGSGSGPWPPSPPPARGRRAWRAPGHKAVVRFPPRALPEL
ncbi:serine/arginine repetitive matrix protein 1-like [Equus quagga]|uniref:serine/arginine repetitive matrix protein 1-like n=1 Tax=Equus quagga TaxID=89248 RepID=UPI001EE367E9|nr:serine/arginine repetitive matrix protein 1-like [Equus quagga]